ncbi:MAG: M16 family metallopeptidase [Bdellovibrionia bacterium]
MLRSKGCRVMMSRVRFQTDFNVARLNKRGLLRRLPGLSAVFWLFVLVLICGFDTLENKDLGLELQIERKVLSNGLEVLLVEDHRVPIISFQTWLRVGSVDEHLGITGVSHLFEHLMFRGTKKYGPREFFQQLETQGAEVNAFTTRDYTVFYENFTPRLLEKVIDLESDRLAHLTVTQDVLDQEKRVILEERQLRGENSVETKMFEALWQLSYRYHPYQWPVMGYVQDLITLPLEALQSFFKTYYQPSNVTLILIGDFKTTEALGWIKKYYEPIASGAQPKREIQSEPPATEERRLILREAVKAEKFAYAYHVGSAQDEDSYALDVLVNILFEGESSQAYQKLVKEKKIATHLQGTCYTPAYPGLLMVSGSMRPRVSSAAAEKEIEALIEKVKLNGVTPEQLKAAIRQLTIHGMDQLRTPYGVGQILGALQMLFRDPKRMMEDFKKYNQVGASDVQRVAQKYLDPNNRVVVTVVAK